MKAMILSAGYGKRLLPLTNNCPKPLLKIGRETLLSNTIKFLKEFGVKQVVINIHYLGNMINEYINKNDFNLNITIVKETDKILDTGGGILNAIQNFSDEPFLVINPDTIWSWQYLEELKLMKKFFFENKQSKCVLLVVDKNKSFDKSFKGDFSLKKNLINRKIRDNLNYIYTGLQIIDPKILLDSNVKIFSMNKIWDKLIENYELNGIESNVDFLHVSTLNIYKSLLKNFKH